MSALFYQNIKIKKPSTETLFNTIIYGLESGELDFDTQAKCVCVDARGVKEKEVGKTFQVWSHGKLEKEIVLNKDTILITTLDKNGNKIVDDFGHENTYDMAKEKFEKRYTKNAQGHYEQDRTPMATIKLPDDWFVDNDQITFLPPNWGGYEGTLVKGGYIMLPVNTKLSKQEQIEAWKKEGAKNLDWYPNNEPETYAKCDKNGIFEDEDLRELFGQSKEIER